jgi:hypothetical protein
MSALYKRPSVNQENTGPFFRLLRKPEILSINKPQSTAALKQVKHRVTIVLCNNDEMWTGAGILVNCPLKQYYLIREMEAQKRKIKPHYSS